MLHIHVDTLLQMHKYICKFLQHTGPESHSPRPRLHPSLLSHLAFLSSIPQSYSAENWDKKSKPGGTVKIGSGSSGLPGRQKQWEWTWFTFRESGVSVLGEQQVEDAKREGKPCSPEASGLLGKPGHTNSRQPKLSRVRPRQTLLQDVEKGQELHWAWEKREGSVHRVPCLRQELSFVP